MVLNNGTINEYIVLLSNFLDRKDLIGYAAARNTRIFKDACVEYTGIRDELIAKYGEQEVDTDGNYTGRYFITTSSPNISKFVSELKPYANIEHDVTIFKIPYSKVIGELTGTEILEIDWMLEDSDSPRDCS